MKDQEFVAQKIRSEYVQTEHIQQDPLQALKALDAKVKRPANIFAYTYGSLGAIVMGAGMSLVMTDIGAVVGMSATLVPGIAIGVAGMTMALTAYPIYKKILSGRKKKYASEILKLSDSILGN